MARDGYLCVGDVAKLLSVSRQTVHNRIHSGRYRADMTSEGARQHYEIPVEDLRQDVGAVGNHTEHPGDAAGLEAGSIMRRTSDEQILDHMRAMWQSHGDLVRVLEAQLERKDESMKRLERKVDELYEDLKTERQRADKTDTGTIEVLAPSEEKNDNERRTNFGPKEPQNTTEGAPEGQGTPEILSP